MVQPAPPVRLYDPRDPGAAARPDPARLQPVRHRAADAGVRLRRFDRRQQSVLRRARSRSESREPRLSGGAARLDAISWRGRRSPTTPSSKIACRSGEHQGRHRNPAGLRPRHQARTSRLGRRLGGRRHAVPRARPSAAICRACTQLYLADPAVKTTAPGRAAARRHRDCGSSTTRISTASTRWCLRPWR